MISESYEGVVQAFKAKILIADNRIEIQYDRRLDTSCPSTNQIVANDYWEVIHSRWSRS